MHAHHRRSLSCGRAVGLFKVNERLPAVSATFHACLNARPAADAAALIDHKDRVIVDTESHARSMRTAATLNSGMFEVGSTARLVS